MGWQDAPLADETPATPAWEAAPLAEPEQPEQPWADYLADLGIQASQGLTFNMADRIAAGIQAGGNAAGRAMGADWEPKTYEDLLKRNQQISQGFEERNPGTALAAQVGGGVAGLALATPARLAQAVERAVARVPTWFGRTAARGATYGAPAGAVSEVGRSPDITNIGDTVNRAKKGAIGGAAAGAVLGPVLEGGLNAAGRVIGPWASDDAQALIDRGVPLTIGETLGGIAKTTEDKLTSLPITGHVIGMAQQRSREGLNRVAMDEVMAPLGGRAAGRTPHGHEAIEEIGDELSARYRTLEPGIVAQLDGPMLAEINQEWAQLPQSVQQDFVDAMVRHIGNVTYGPQRMINGRDFLQGVRSLRDEGRRLITGGASLPYAYDLGQALNNVARHLQRSGYRHSPPDVMTALRATDQAYARLIRVEKAAGSVAAQGGVFTPAMLHNAVKAADRSKNKRAFARGNADMQDLSGPAKRVMTSRIPDSGSPGRLLMAALTQGAGAGTGTLPYTLGVEAAGSALYSSPVQALLRRLAAGGAHGRQQARDIIERLRDQLRPGQMGFGASDELREQTGAQ